MNPCKQCVKKRNCRKCKVRKDWIRHVMKQKRKEKNMRRLVDADVLYEQIAKKEELARQRVLDTPSRMPNGDLNPSAIRYHAQLDERTQMKFMIADAPTIDAIPIAYIEKCIAELDTWIPKFKKENTGNLILTKEYLKWILNWWKFMNKEYVNE